MLEAAGNRDLVTVRFLLESGCDIRARRSRAFISMKWELTLVVDGLTALEICEQAEWADGIAVCGCGSVLGCLTFVQVCREFAEKVSVSGDGPDSASSFEAQLAERRQRMAVVWTHCVGIRILEIIDVY